MLGQGVKRVEHGTRKGTVSKLRWSSKIDLVGALNRALIPVVSTKN